MDMSNATAAGPSRGLLDVLFGSKPEEANEADGQEFLPLMNLIKAMNNENQEDEAGNRTDKEIAPGKGVVDYSAVGMPGMLPYQLMAPPTATPEEGAGADSAKASAQSLSPAMLAMGMPLVPSGAPQSAAVGKNGEKISPNSSAVSALDPALVNRLLREKSLPPLNAEEAKLLETVNGKMAALASKGVAANSTEVAVPDLKAAVPANPQEAALQRELAARGIDTSQLRGPEGNPANAAPEKFLSTEAYLQMHDRFGKGPNKTEAEAVKRMGGEGAENTGATATAAKNAELPQAVTAAEGKGKDLFGRTDRELPEMAKIEKAGAKLSAVPFDATLTQSIKGQIDTRDVVLSGTKPNEIRGALLGEVGQGVSQHALKGGGEMRLVIHPEALGEVKLKIGTRDGKVEVQVHAQNEDVAQILRGGSKDLERSLRDQNLALAKFEVSVTADAPVASADTRSNLSDQFLGSQNQSGFSQAGAEREQRFSQWDGNQSNRQASAEVMTEENQPRSAKRPASTARDGSRRLDVVA